MKRMNCSERALSEHPANAIHSLCKVMNTARNVSHKIPNPTTSLEPPPARHRSLEYILSQMAPAGSSSATILDPSTLPQVAFARADDLLSGATQLRAKAESLRARAIENENKAKKFENSAAELQASAEEDREYVQAELDTTLEYHGDVLAQFLLTPDNELEVRSLSTSVEEGRAYVHEVMALGEKLLQVKAAKLQPSQQVKKTSLIDLSETEGSKSPGSQILSWIPTSLCPLSSSTPSTAPWQTRFRSLFGRQVLDTDHPAYTSLIQPESSESSVGGQKQIGGSLDKVETRDDGKPETRNITEAPSPESYTSANSILTEVLQNAILPVVGQTASVEVASRRQNNRKTKDTSSEPISSQEVYRSQVEEGSTPSEPPETDSPTSKTLKRKSPGFDILVSGAKRRKRARIANPNEDEKATAFNRNKMLARYRELHDSGTPEEKMKKTLKREMEKKVENYSQISVEGKARLIEYGHKQIDSMIKTENKRREEEHKENKRRAEAVGKKESELEVTDEEKTAFFNEPKALVRYRELVASVKGKKRDKRTKAKKVLQKEINHRMHPISKWRKSALFLHAKQQINAMATGETKRLITAHPEAFPPRRVHEHDEISDLSADDPMLGGGNESGEDGQAAELYTTEWSDVVADDAVMGKGSGHREYAQLEDLYAAELSDESADEAMWP
jgi:hypothetical protein